MMSVAEVIMSQTIRRSWVEAWINILIGFGINFTANMVILPLFGFRSLTVENNIYIGIIYTGISLIRTFCIRRIFNRGDDKFLTNSYKYEIIFNNERGGQWEENY
jgi:hypothetical protein